MKIYARNALPGLLALAVLSAVSACPPPAGAADPLPRLLPEALETELALKILHPGLLSDPVARTRFMREAELGKSIDHPAVVRTHDTGSYTVGATTYHGIFPTRSGY